MPNNILITPGSASIQFSGSAASTIRLQVEASGSIAFYGNSGSLFGITDSLSGSLMSVNDISGLPILEVFSDDRIVMGTFNKNTLVVTGSRIGIDKAVPTADLDISGSVFITGSLRMNSGGITGSLFGTASWAQSSSVATSASYAATASNLTGGTANYIPLWASATLLSSSAIYQSAGNIGIGVTPSVKLEVGVPGTSDASIIAGIFGKTGGNAYGSTVLRVSRYTGTTDLTVGADVPALDLEYNSGGSGPFRYGTFADAVISSGNGATNGPYGAIHFATSGSIGMTIGGGTLAGKVGIGTTSPTLATLQVAGSILSTTGINIGGNGGFYNAANKFGIDVNGAVTRFYASGPDATTAGSYEFHTIASDGTPDNIVMTISNAGNLGLGTASPAKKLDVLVNTANGNGFQLTNGNNSAYATIEVNGATGYGVTGWANSTVIESVPASTGGLVLGAYSGPITFQTNLRTGGMTLTQTGNLGLGTTSPQYTLDINGDINISGSSRRIYGDFSSSPISSRTMFQSTVANGNTNVYAIPNGTSNAATFTVGNTSSIDNSSIGQFAATATEISVRSSIIGTGTYLPLLLYTNGLERLRIDTSGSVGIGTATPSASLHVSGTTMIAQIIEKVNVTGSAPPTTFNVDLTSGSIFFRSASTAANWTANFRGNTTTPLNSMMYNGQSITATVLVLNGATAYSASAYQIDGASIIPRWQGGTSGSANANSLDAHQFTIIKVASASYVMLGSITKYT